MSNNDSADILRYLFSLTERSIADPSADLVPEIRAYAATVGPEPLILITAATVANIAYVLTRFSESNEQAVEYARQALTIADIEDAMSALTDDDGATI